MAPFDVEPGKSVPLGASVWGHGVNFSVYARGAWAAELVLFDGPEDTRPARTIPLDPRRHRAYHYWHAFVPGIGAGQLYGWRCDGPWAPERGLRFDPSKTLLDPYGRAVAVPGGYDRDAASHPGAETPPMKSVVVDLRGYDWEGDRPLRHPISRTVIYEMHVAGFTKHPSSGVPADRRGTYAGLVDRIPYLRDLGITAVELLPVFQFDRQDAPAGRVNYWGYSPVSFFAPHAAYAAAGNPTGAVNEFRDMVRALHRAGIEVILDVVYNHTAEGDHRGPTLSFRGLSNDSYYLLESDRSRYANYTGTGNTLNGNHSVVRRMIVDSLRYWSEAMHVDGFRFDLASVLARDESGRPLENPPVLWEIESEPALAGAKLIAEAWDPGGLYQVGSFVGDAWLEWNGRFRDDVRSFVRGEAGCVSKVASRVLASPDLYAHEDREPEQSVNFVTCHDGFTLNDLVSYDRKHNEANGEDDRDGSDDNRSWNHGVEGPTDVPAIERLRNRQVKNLLAITLLSLGTPMLLMGDETRRTQRGNNNAYCQDSDLSWFDWSLVERHADILRFARKLVVSRSAQPAESPRYGMSLNEVLRRAHVEWHGTRLGKPDWSDASRSLSFTVQSLGGRTLLHVILNAYWEPLTFELPPVPPRPGERWRRWVDTGLESPEDVADPAEAPEVAAKSYRAEARSVVVLLARRNGG